MDAGPHELDAWRSLPIKQQPQWSDADAVAAVSAEIATLPPLVFAGEVDILRDRLARAASGNAFLLQGGDCAETFAGATAEQIRNRIKTVLQMAVVLTYGASMPVVKMGRMAGQFAKPRSSDTETRGDVTLPAYRGDIVNGFDFTEASRRPDPARLLKGYHTAASTINLIRAFTQGGFADLREVHSWNKGFAENPANQAYERLAHEIDRAIKFMEAAGADFDELRRRRVLHGPRGPADGLRAPDDAHRLAHRHAVQHLGALPLDRGAHARPRRRARRLLLEDPQPDRGQARALDDAPTRPWS